MEENSVPASAMVIVAHPDDAEFSMAGTVAAWARAGCVVTYLICTNGNAGTQEITMTRERLAEIRRAEQQAACQVLGVTRVEFLDYDDGVLQPTLEFRHRLVQAIRREKPEVVLTSDPTRLLVGDRYINHPDHRAAGLAALEAVYPASAQPLLWPEAGPAHRVRQVYIYGNDEPNTWIDISETIGRKIQALKKHVSQLDGWDPTERITEGAAKVAEGKGMQYAESFRVMTLVQPAKEETKE